MAVSKNDQRALLSAHKELDGLVKRSEAAGVNFALLIGNDTYGGGRDDQVNKALDEVEREFMRVNSRITELRAHIESLRHLDSAVQTAIDSGRKPSSETTVISVQDGDQTK